MQRRRLVLPATAVIMLSACSDSDFPTSPDSPTAQDYSASLTEVTMVKQGSDEEIAIDGLPANGATLTSD